MGDESILEKLDKVTKITERMIEDIEREEERRAYELRIVVLFFLCSILVFTLLVV